MRRETWATLGSVGSAAASSACCWLPLLMVATGFSIAGASAFFDSWRPVFLIVAAALLSTGFYLNYRPQKTVCGPDGSCETPSVRLRRLNRGMLWVSAVLVLTLALFPNYVGRLLGAQSTAAEVTRSRMLVIDIEGMTCAGCELAVRTTLAELPEVADVDASYVDGQAIVRLTGAATPSLAALTAAVGKAGYTLIAVSDAEVEAVSPLAGHWITEVPEDTGEPVVLTMDLDLVNSRWIGTFDVPKHGIDGYPVEVSAVDPGVRLFLTAIGLDFEGTLSDDGQALTGQGRVGDQLEDISFRRTGDAEFSEDFLELEAAADDLSLVEKLGSDASALRKRFNTDSGKTRLLMLLAPT